jgi:hypothetical protein
LLFVVRCKSVLAARALKLVVDRMSSSRIEFGLFFKD